MVALVRGKSKLLPPCATGQLGFRTVVLPRAMFIICLAGLLFFFFCLLVCFVHLAFSLTAPYDAAQLCAVCCVLQNRLLYVCFK